MTGNMLGNILALVKRHRIMKSQSHEIFVSEFQYMKNVVYRVVKMEDHLEVKKKRFVLKQTTTFRYN